MSRFFIYFLSWVFREFIGLNSSHFFVLGTFSIRVTVDFFQFSGKTPVFKDVFNTFTIILPVTFQISSIILFDTRSWSDLLFIHFTILSSSIIFIFWNLKTYYALHQQHLSAFEEDYKASPENSQPLPALRFMKNELEELWSLIDGKFKQIRESPQLNDPEISNSINFNGLSRNVRSAKKFYRLSMISIDESTENFTQPRNSTPTQPEPKQPTQSVGFNVPLGPHSEIYSRLFMAIIPI